MLCPARVRVVLAIAALAIGLGARAHAEDFPTRYIKVIVGPGLDTPARVFGAKMADVLGQQVVIEPRPGAGGVIAVQAAAAAPPDGYTLLLATAAYTINTALGQSPLDLRRDFAPIGLATTVKYVLVLHPSVPAHDLPSLIAYMKAHPGGINYASPGIGTPPHLAGELFKAMTGVEIVHVPFRDANSAIAAVVGGSVQMMFSLAATAEPQIAAGSLRGIAVTSIEPSPFVPGIKPLAELGLPGFDVLGWNGFVAPRGTPAPVIAKLNAAMNAGFADEQLHQRVLASGYEPYRRNTPEEFSQFIAADTAKWIGVVKAIKLKGP
jgi:tripartite-type tricarboxylate transporter receptor subunit TctC